MISQTQDNMGVYRVIIKESLERKSFELEAELVHTSKIMRSQYASMQILHTDPVKPLPLYHEVVKY